MNILGVLDRHEFCSYATYHSIVAPESEVLKKPLGTGIIASGIF